MTRLTLRAYGTVGASQIPLVVEEDIDLDALNAMPINAAEKHLRAATYRVVRALRERVARNERIIGARNSTHGPERATVAP